MVPHTCSCLLTVSVFIKCYASVLRNSMEQPKHMHLIKIAHAFLWTMQIHNCFVKSLSLSLSGSTWIQSTWFSKIYFKTLLPRVSEVFWLVSSRFTNMKLEYLISLLHASCPPWFHWLNNIWWSVQITMTWQVLTNLDWKAWIDETICTGLFYTKG